MVRRSSKTGPKKYPFSTYFYEIYLYFFFLEKNRLFHFWDFFEKKYADLSTRAPKIGQKWATSEFFVIFSKILKISSCRNIVFFAFFRKKNFFLCFFAFSVESGTLFRPQFLQKSEKNEKMRKNGQIGVAVLPQNQNKK